MGAIIATHSVTEFASFGVCLIVGGVLLSAIAIWPVLKRDIASNRIEAAASPTTLQRAS
jgi:hypothetical protein